MPKAVIKNIDSLEALRIALLRFCETCDNELYSIDSGIQTRLNALCVQESRFRHAIEKARDELKMADRSLRDCKAESYYDEDGYEHEPDCDFEQEEVYTAKKRLSRAEHNYEVFKTQINKVKASKEKYQKPKIKYKSFIQWEREIATSSLKQLINGAEDYISVSSPIGFDASMSLNMTESIAEKDPTMVIATAIGIAELMLDSVMSLFGLSGEIFRMNNTQRNGTILTTYTENDTIFVCSELKMENKSSGKRSNILAVSIPKSLENQRIGKPLIQNMESISRKNGCSEIYGWANSRNVSFYKSLGYQSRNEVKDSGAEMYKSLNSLYPELQFQARRKFSGKDNAEFYKDRNWRREEINPLHVISPSEVNDDKFWKQHDSDGKPRYLELIANYQICKDQLESGKSIDEIRRENFYVANAFDVFNGNDPIRLVKSGDFYNIDSNGRHRIAAAQEYFFQTGEIVNIPADVYTKSEE